MYRFTRQQTWPHLHRWWRCSCLPSRRLLPILLVLTALYGLWPYATLWRLNQVLLHNDQATLTVLVDVDAVRDAIRQRLNKDEVSPIGTISDGFIDWLDAGIRYHGLTALDHLVTFAWVREQLRARAPADQGFLSSVTMGSFTGWREFQAQLDAEMLPPLVLRLRLDTQGWRVVTLYY